jgi:hypothetical protein
VRALAVVLGVLAVLAATRGLVRHNTWYLASDQFAFLTFADDLLRGTVFHDPTVVALVAGPSLAQDAAADAYYQTYIYRDGRLYSRYPPGYPLLLAAAKLVGGETAAHWLNPLLYLTLLAVLGWLAARLAPARSARATGIAAMWALLVIPVEVHYWGITVVRDLPAHLLAVLAIAAALAAAPAIAGLLLGLAATMRPDAVLWGPSIALAFPPGARDARLVVRGSAAFAIGLLPLLAYNTVTQGHPLAFTQGSEFRSLFHGSLAGLPATLLGGVSYVSGGGFRLANLPGTLVAHLRYLTGAFGVFFWLALATLVVGLVRRWAVARVLGPYVVVGLLFYSCWGHGDARYLVGVSLGLIVLAASGAVVVAERLADPGTRRATRMAGVLVVVGLLAASWTFARASERGLGALERASGVSLVAAAATALVPAARVIAPFAPALAFATFGALRIAGASGSSDGFRAADVERARRTIQATVPPASLVLMSHGLGRPAENWTHYTHAEAHYFGELGRLLSDANLAVHRATGGGRRAFVLLAVGEPAPFTVPREWLRMREVARREGEALRDWFVDPKRAPRGAVLYETAIGLSLPAP